MTKVVKWGGGYFSASYLDKISTSEDNVLIPSWGPYVLDKLAVFSKPSEVSHSFEVHSVALYISYCELYLYEKRNKCCNFFLMKKGVFVTEGPVGAIWC